MLWHVPEFPAFLRLKNTPWCGWTPLCSSLCGRPGHLRLLAPVNRAAVDVGVQPLPAAHGRQSPGGRLIPCSFRRLRVGAGWLWLGLPKSEGSFHSFNQHASTNHCPWPGPGETPGAEK